MEIQPRLLSLGMLVNLIFRLPYIAFATVVIHRFASDFPAASLDAGHGIILAVASALLLFHVFKSSEPLFTKIQLQPGSLIISRPWRHQIIPLDDFDSMWVQEYRLKWFDFLVGSGSSRSHHRTFTLGFDNCHTVQSEINLGRGWDMAELKALVQQVNESKTRPV